MPPRTCKLCKSVSRDIREGKSKLATINVVGKHGTGGNGRESWMRSHRLMEETKGTRGARAVCAFLNLRGGRVPFGVRLIRNLVRQQISKCTIDEMEAGATFSEMDCEVRRRW